jgi:hypothetical protein
MGNGWAILARVPRKRMSSKFRKYRHASRTNEQVVRLPRFGVTKLTGESSTCFLDRLIALTMEPASRAPMSASESNRFGHVHKMLSKRLPLQRLTVNVNRKVGLGSTTARQPDSRRSGTRPACPSACASVGRMFPDKI